MASAMIPPVEVPTIQSKSSVILRPVISSICINTSIWISPFMPPPSRHRMRSPPCTLNTSGVSSVWAERLARCAILWSSLTFLRRVLMVVLPRMLLEGVSSSWICMAAEGKLISTSRCNFPPVREVNA